MIATKEKAILRDLASRDREIVDKPEQTHGVGVSGAI